MYSAGSNFFRGCGYAFSGILEFWRRPRLWLYMIVPLLLVKAICSCIGYTLWHCYAEPCVTRIRDCVAGWGGTGLASFCEGAMIVLAVLGFLIIMASVSSMLFELFGSLPFTYMVRRYEHMVYGMPLTPPISFWQDTMNMVSCIVYSCVTFLLSMFFLALGVVFPLAAQIMAAMFVGYRYGISYCSEAGFNHGWSIRKLQFSFTGQRMVLYGFGVAVFVLLLIPILSMFLIPGFVIGGTRLVHEEHRHRFGFN